MKCLSRQAPDLDIAFGDAESARRRTRRIRFGDAESAFGDAESAFGDAGR
jgi:hypothetical protein